jgi:AcrR family transcriptional regulator
VPVARGLSREGRKQETRRAILRSAARLFARRGIAATSIDRIAAEIGLTSGAVYAHFASKRELINAVGQESSLTVDPEFLFREDLSLAEKLEAVADAFAGIRSRVTPQHVLLDLEFTLDELRNRRRVHQMSAATRRFRQEAGKRLDDSARARGNGALPMPGAEMIALIVAVARGVVVETSLDPGAISEQSVRTLFRLLAGEPPGSEPPGGGESRRAPSGREH